MATASILPMPRNVFYDANGNPLSGGIVFTYIPGSTSPKTTWMDAAETIPNTAPIVLDSAGSCLLYGGGAYQLTVTDSAGNAVPGYSGISSDLSLSVTQETTRATAAEAAILAGFGASLGGIGYQKLPNGFIRQWGLATTVAGGGVAAGYAIAFPNAALSFLTTMTGATGPAAFTVVCGVAGLTFTNVWCANSTTGAAAVGVTFYWEAIGN